MRKIQAIVTMFCLIAGGALADSDVVLAKELAMVAAVLDCTASAGFAEDPRSCVGASYETCLSFSSGSHADEGDCMKQVARVWEATYQAALLEVLADAQEQDADPAHLGSALFGQFQRVLEAEAVWTAYRAAQCDFEMTKWGAGTIVMTERPRCEMRLTAERIAFLRDFRGTQR